MMSSKPFVTVAVTGGIHVPSQSPYLPIKPDEIVEEVLRAEEAGAAVAHIHARNPETGQPSSDLELYQEIVGKIKARSQMVLCITTGGALGMSLEERIAAVPALKPELASFNMGSINFALYPALEKIDQFQHAWEKEYLEMTEDFAFVNTFKALKYFSSTMNAYQTRQELEIYDVGHLYNAAQIIGEGYLQKPVYLQFVMGILGAIQPGVDNLLFLVNTARKVIGEFHWSVCAVGRHQLPMAAVALVMGGNVRVGLEDSLYIAKGQLAKHSAEQVAKVARMAKDLSIELATPEEVRSTLGLKGLEHVNY